VVQPICVWMNCVSVWKTSPTDAPGHGAQEITT
jgi:hypothetical protein